MWLFRGFMLMGLANGYLEEIWAPYSVSDESLSLEYTPTWVVAVVCFVIVLISLCAERGLHRLGKCLKNRHQDALFEALQKLKGELMLLGFISLLLTVFQGLISEMCIPKHMASLMLPCKRKSGTSSSPEIHYYQHFSHQIVRSGRHLLAAGSGSTEHCASKGKVPMLSLEALHQLHIFIFVLAVVHVIFCATTMVLGGAKIREWKRWEDSIRNEMQSQHAPSVREHHYIFKQRAGNYWRKAVVVSWIIAFFKQFYGSVTKSDYVALRLGFIREHCPSLPNFDFHKYMLRTLEVDYKRIVGISWYLWLFVVFFLLLNIEGWHTYFWLSFLPLILLLLVGAKLEHIISRLAREVAERTTDPVSMPVRPSDDLFWFHSPRTVLYLIHFILFQNSFEIAFFFWIWSTYGFHTCIMEKLGFIIPRLVMGVVVQVLCSYSTLPLYALVTQMGSMFKPEIFNTDTHDHVMSWVTRTRSPSSHHNNSTTNGGNVHRMSFENNYTTTGEAIMVDDQGTTTCSMIELSYPHPNSKTNKQKKKKNSLVLSLCTEFRKKLDHSVYFTVLLYFLQETRTLFFISSLFFLPFVCYSNS